MVTVNSSWALTFPIFGLQTQTAALYCPCEAISCEHCSQRSYIFFFCPCSRQSFLLSQDSLLSCLLDLRNSCTVCSSLWFELAVWLAGSVQHLPVPLVTPVTSTSMHPVWEHQGSENSSDTPITPQPPPGFSLIWAHGCGVSNCLCNSEKSSTKLITEYIKSVTFVSIKIFCTFVQ